MAQPPGTSRARPFQELTAGNLGEAELPAPLLPAHPLGQVSRPRGAGETDAPRLGVRAPRGPRNSEREPRVRPTMAGLQGACPGRWERAPPGRSPRASLPRYQPPNLSRRARGEAKVPPSLRPLSFPGRTQRPKPRAAGIGWLAVPGRRAPGPGRVPSGPHCCGSRRPSGERGRQRHSPPAPRLRAAPGRAGPRASRSAAPASAGSGRQGRGWRPRREAAGQARAPRTGSGRAPGFSGGGGARSLRSRSAAKSVPPAAREPGPSGQEHTPPRGTFRRPTLEQEMVRIR